MARVIEFVNKLINFWGKVAGFLTLVLVLCTVWDVTLRYVFKAGSVSVQELEWHLFGLIFLLGIGFTHARDAHVRVDIFYGRMSARSKALVDTIGCLCFLLPFCVLVIWTSIPFVESSYRVMERSPDPGGLPFRFILKAALPMGFVFLALQALSSLVTDLCTLFGFTKGEKSR